MNNRTAKKIRSMIPHDEAIGRRNYRRAKKLYTRLPEKAKPIFLASLKTLMNPSD